MTKKFIVLILALIASVLNSEATVTITNLSAQSDLFSNKYEDKTAKWKGTGQIDFYRVYVYIADNRTQYADTPTYIYIAKRPQQKVYLPKTGWAKIQVSAINDGVESDKSEAVEFLDASQILDHDRVRRILGRGIRR